MYCEYVDVADSKIVMTGDVTADVPIMVGDIIVLPSNKRYRCLERGVVFEKEKSDIIIPMNGKARIIPRMVIAMRTEEPPSAEQK